MRPGVARMSALLLALPSIANLTAPARADDFYSGRRITLIVGSETGGGYDSYSRLLARHMSKYVPGAPPIVVQNAPGASGLTAANNLYNAAPRDGTVIGMISRTLPIQSLVERNNPNIRFDAVRFNWIGTMSNGSGDGFVLLVRDDMPVRSVEELRGPNARELLIGASAGGQLYELPVMLKEILGLNFKIVAGYAGSTSIALALMRKEVDGRVTQLSVLRATQPELLNSHLVRVLMQLGRAERHPDFPDVPLSRELAANDNDRALLELVDMPQLVSWPVVAPPDVPAERVALLRKAFMETQKDQGYQADAAKAKMELSPESGEALQALLGGLKQRLTPELTARYSAIASRVRGGK